MSDRRPRRSRRYLRAALISLVVIMVLGGIAVGAFVESFDANAYKPRIVAAVKAATGRDLALNGSIRLKFALHPTIELRDVALANPPGFSRPEMAAVRALDLKVGLAPLISRRLVIDRLVLISPDILLERNASGQVNWQFSPPPPTVAASQSAVPARETRPPEATRSEPAPTQAVPRFELRAARIENGTLGYRDDRTGQHALLALNRLDGGATSVSAPLHLSAQAVIAGTQVNLEADGGSFADLTGGNSRPWPIKTVLTAAGAKLSAEGTVAEPLSGRGYKLETLATVPDLAAFRPFFSTTKLPALRDVTFAAQIAGSRGKFPAVSDILLRVGASELSAITPGLTLTKLDLAAPSLQQDVQLAAVGGFAGTPLTLGATLGPLSALIAGHSSMPFPVDVTAAVAGARLAVKGRVADPVRLGGVDLTATGNVPDLAALAPLAGRPLPALHNIAASARLNDINGLRHGLALSDLRLTSGEADLAGAVEIAFTAKPGIRANLTSQRVDADALRAELAIPAAAHPVAGPGAGPAVGSAPKPPPKAAAGHVIPDTPIPFNELRHANADIQIVVATLISGGASWHDASGHLVVQDGKLALPISATLPSGPLALTLSADAAGPSPTVAASLRAPALPLQMLLAAFGQPGYATGAVGVAADLRGAGPTPHAIAASLDGMLTLSMNGGTIETRLLEQALGPAIARANPLGLLGSSATSPIRCAVVRVQVRHGVAQIAPLLFSSPLITINGSGRINLGAEMLDLTLHPQGRAGGVAIAVPVVVSGGFRAPRVSFSDKGALQAGLNAALDALAHKGARLGGSGETGPACASVPGEAQGRATGRAARSGPAKLPNPASLLRQFLR